MHSKEPLLLALLLASLLVVGVLCATSVRAEALAGCQPVTSIELAQTPAAIHPGVEVDWTASSEGASPPLTYTWTFGDGSAPVAGVVPSDTLTASHTYTASGVYTVALAVANACTAPPLTITASVTVSEPDADPIASRAWMPMVLRLVHLSPPPHLGYGANVASADHAISLTVLGFDWAKGFVRWNEAGPGPKYNWAAVDNQLREFVPHVQNVLLRLDGPPPDGVGNPPVTDTDLSAFRAFAQALAAHVAAVWRDQGLETAAYEIWNEPNLDYEWGGQPDAAQYTALLKAGYEGIKAADPEAIVVSAGLATTGGSLWDLNLVRQVYNATLVVPDLTFLRIMYDSGAKGYLDALGSHPYGGRDAPGTPPAEASGPIYFRRAEEQHEVMLAYGDTSPVWATEFGWVLETECNLGPHEWMEVDETHQAEYLAAAYSYADEYWPWMGPMLFFNLDFATVYWYYENPCDPMRWYSITYRQDPADPGNSPILARQAFDRLRDLPKRSAW